MGYPEVWHGWLSTIQNDVVAKVQKQDRSLMAVWVPVASCSALLKQQFCLTSNEGLCVCSVASVEGMRDTEQAGQARNPD